MALANGFRSLNPSSSFQAQRVPVDEDELKASSFNYTQSNLRHASVQYSENLALDELMAPVFDRIQQRTGEENLMLGPRSQGHKLMQVTTDETGINQPPRAQTIGQGQYLSMAADLRKRGETEFPTWEEIVERAKHNADTDKETFEQDMLFNVATSPRMDAFIGGGASMFTDPVMAASVAMTLPFGVAMTATRAFAFEAAIGLATEIPIQEQVQAWHLARGHEYSNEEVMKALLIGTVLPGTFGAAFSKGYRMMGGAAPELFRGADYDITRMATAVKQRKMGYLELAAIEEDAVRSGKGTLERQYNGYQLSNFNEPSFGGAYSPSMTTSAYRMAGDLPEGDPLRTDLLGAARDLHMHQNNPAVASLGTDNTGLETLSYTFTRSAVQDMHQENTVQALGALQNLRAPSPPNKQTLSIQIFTMAEDVNHYEWTRNLFDLEATFSLGNKFYRTELAEIVADQVLPGLRRLLDSVDEVPTKRVGPTVKHPSRSPETLRKQILSTGTKMTELAKKHKAGMKTLRADHRKVSRVLGVEKKKKAVKAKRAEYDKQIADREAGQREWAAGKIEDGASEKEVEAGWVAHKKTIAKLKKDRQAEVKKINAMVDQKKLDKRVTAAQTKITDAEATYKQRVSENEARITGWNESLEQHKLADGADLHAQRLNAMRTIQEDVELLESGVVPPAYRAMRDDLHESFKRVKESSMFRVSERLDPKATTLLKRVGEYRVVHDQKDWHAIVRDHDEAVAASKKADEIEALDAEFARLDIDFKFDMDGEAVTAQKIKDDVDRAEEALDAMANECNKVATPE